MIYHIKTKDGVRIASTTSKSKADKMLKNYGQILKIEEENPDNLHKLLLTEVYEVQTTWEGKITSISKTQGFEKLSFALQDKIRATKFLLTEEGNYIVKFVVLEKLSKSEIEHIAYSLLENFKITAGGLFLYACKTSRKSFEYSIRDGMTTSKNKLANSLILQEAKNKNELKRFVENLKIFFKRRVV